jgi:hypothetical protein
LDRRILSIVTAVVALGFPARGAADVLPVPDAVRHMHAPKEETNAIRSPSGAVIGEQRFQASVADDRLTFEVITRFTSGDESDEHGEMDLSDGFRSRRYDKSVRRDGSVVQEQHVDFVGGNVRWRADGSSGERAMAFPPDTYVGPMLAVVLAGVPEQQPAARSFEAVVFRPDPQVVTLRAEVVDEEAHPLGTRVPSAAKLRVKADLGPIKNVVFASLIPTHYFWFTRSEAPEFVGFEGKLWNGLEVVMTAEAAVTTTAHAR